MRQSAPPIGLGDVRPAFVTIQVWCGRSGMGQRTVYDETDICGQSRSLAHTHRCRARANLAALAPRGKISPPRSKEANRRSAPFA